MDKNQKNMKFLKLKTKKKANKWFVKAYSMTEILIVLCIIGILYLLVVPDQSAVVGQAKAIEAQSMLNQVFALEKSYFYRYSKYANNLDDIGFQSQKSIEDGGQAVYRIEIVDAGSNVFIARATSLSDFDGDGIFNVWEINEQKLLKEVTKD